MTATEIIDQLADKIMHLVTEENAGRNITEAQFEDAFNRAFAAAFKTFRAAMEPELRARFDKAYQAEYTAN